MSFNSTASTTSTGLDIYNDKNAHGIVKELGSGYNSNFGGPNALAIINLSNPIAFTTNGTTPAMVINTSSDVSIGSTTDAGLFSIATSSNIFTALSNGNISIGDGTVNIQLPNPIGTPTLTTGVFSPGLPAGTTYYIKCTALSGAGETLPTSESSITIPDGTSEVNITCPVVPNATAYRFYYSTSAGAENQFVTNFTNTDMLYPAMENNIGAPPSSNTAYSAQINASGNSSFGGSINAQDFMIGNATTTPVILYEGDSLTKGSHGTYPYNYYITPPTYNGLTFNQFNIGLGGQTVLQMLNHESQVLNPFYSNNSGENIVVVWGGTNDLGDGATPSSTFSYLEQFCQHARSMGWKVLVVTMISRIGLDVQKDILNPLIQNNWQLFSDGLVDLGSDPYLGVDGAYASTTWFYTDGIHLTDAGYSRVGSLVQSALNALVNTPNNAYNYRTSLSIGTTTTAGAINIYGPSASINFKNFLNNTSAGINITNDASTLGLVKELGSNYANIYGGPNALAIINLTGPIALTPGGTVPSIFLATSTNVGIGTTTPSTKLQVAGASSTIRIGSSALPGCLEVGNSDGSAGINYVTFLNGTMTATTTQPANCE